MFVDTHAHLYHHRFGDDRNDMVQRAVDAGVGRIYLPNIDEDSITPMDELVNAWPGVCFQMMGLHPCSVIPESSPLLEKMRGLLETGKYVAVGEIGIDLYWEKKYRMEQEDAFRQQVCWAKDLGLPIVIHCRNSFEEVIRIVEEENSERLRGVFHCFTGSAEEARRILGLGNFHLGIGGVVTYKNSGLIDVLNEIGIEQCLLETDSPYLAPVPFRGKRNESSYIKHIVEHIANNSDHSVEEIGKLTTENADRLFGFKDA